MNSQRTVLGLSVSLHLFVILVLSGLYKYIILLTQPSNLSLDNSQRRKLHDNFDQVFLILHDN